MKHPVILIICIILSHCSSGQEYKYTEVDRYASTVGYHAPDTLSALLTRPYTSDLKKVRSIFYWIATHISYDLEKARGPRLVQFTYYSSDDSLRKRMQMVAQTVTDRKGICEDYADLFTTLCKYAGIRSEVVVGYARDGGDNAGKEKTADHAWNAVMIDHKWYLLDVTWASGYSNSSGIYTSRFNDYYFLTNPELMKLNHYPEDSKWLLTKTGTSLSDFFNFPTIYFDMETEKLRSFAPLKGVINARMGSTLRFAFEVDDTTKNIEVVGYPYEETHPNYTSSYADYSHPNTTGIVGAVPASAGRHYIQVSNSTDEIFEQAHKQQAVTTPKEDNPVMSKNSVARTYHVNNPMLQEIHVYYNDVLMLRYIVNINK